MKLSFIVIVLTCFIAVKADIYKDRLNNVDIDEVLSNKRLLVAYIKCTLGKGRCTPEGKELKSHISEALQNGCESCTDGQKDSVRKVIGYLIKNEGSYWKELVEKYDTDGVYSEKYESELSAL